jgi:hypothetical protein
MRAAFPRYLVPARAADLYQQARCDATPETETRHATRPADR